MSIVTPEWVRDAVFYQVFPDRFARSGRVEAPGPLEHWDAPPTLHGFKGGDLYGVVERLDELAELGITAIYLTPIFASASNHRYHTYDYFEVDPLLGGDAALRELLDAAHARGMRVILDGVFNHASRGFWPFNHILECGLASPYLDWFRVDRELLAQGRPLRAYPDESLRQGRRRGGRSMGRCRASCRWATAPGGTSRRCPSSTPTTRRSASTYSASPSTGSGSGPTAGAWTWPPRSTTTSSGASSGAASRRSTRSAYIVAEVWHEDHRWLQGDQFDAFMNYPLAARSSRSAPAATSTWGSSRPLDVRREHPAGGRPEVRGRRRTTSFDVRPGRQRRPAEPPGQPRHAAGPHDVRRRRGGRPPGHARPDDGGRRAVRLLR